MSFTVERKTSSIDVVRFDVRGVTYKIALLDDGLVIDPTLLLFREDEEEAIATIHLDPESVCTARFGYAYDHHIVVRRSSE
jgi:hypothetical protein